MKIDVHAGLLSVSLACKLFLRTQNGWEAMHFSYNLIHHHGNIFLCCFIIWFYILIALILSGRGDICPIFCLGISTARKCLKSNIEYPWKVSLISEPNPNIAPFSSLQFLFLFRFTCFEADHSLYQCPCFFPIIINPRRTVLLKMTI